MKVPLLDLSCQNGPLLPDIATKIQEVAASGRFIMGPEVEAFEEELSHVQGCTHVVGVSSGTDALLVALMGLGVGPGDEVLTTPFSFFATAGVVSRLGARPVFSDIEPDSFNLDPTRLEVGSKTKAVIPVHLFGRRAEAPKVDVAVVEDAAQAVGLGSLNGLVGCLSFFPSKNLGAFGDGGAVYCNDDAFADKMRLLRVHGGRPKYYHQIVGGNFRLDALQAAILRVKLPHLSAWTAQRRANAQRYRQLFAQASVPPELRLPVDTPEHIYNQFVVRVPKRDELKSYLQEAGIGTEIYYPVPFHQQPCFAELGYKKGAFPQAETAAAEVLAIPVYPGLSADAQQYVVESIAAFYR